MLHLTSLMRCSGISLDPSGARFTLQAFVYIRGEKIEAWGHIGAVGVKRVLTPPEYSHYFTSFLVDKLDPVIPLCV